MNRQLAREKKRLYIRIMAVLLGVWLIISCAYAFISYNSAKQQLITEAELDCSRVGGAFDEYEYSNIPLGTFTMWERVNALRNDNSQIVIKNSSGEVTVHTDNTFSDEFQIDHTSDYVFCVMEFKDFYNSMTPEQYKKITDWLKSSPEDENEYYELICSEYYVYNKTMPTVVEIVKTSKNNTWYVQDEVMERFELNPEIPQGAAFYKIGEMHRNVIPTDFVLSGGMDEDITGNLTSGQRYYADLLNEPLIKTAPFTYVYYRQMTVYYFLDDNYSRSDYYKIRYGYKFNVLDYCLENIAIALGLIFVLFLAVGTVLWIMAWHIIKNRAEQEEKRRNLTSSVAHQLKTPLFVIGGYAENLKENVMTEKREHYADVILQQTKSMNSLVQTMLDFSSLEADSFQPEKEPFELAELVKPIVEDFEISASDKEFHLDIKGNGEIYADKKLIENVIEIFLDNAVKYAEKSEIEVLLTEDCFSVSNACDSLKKSDLKEIWEPYSRMKNGYGKQGSGLGLSIAKTILDRHGFKSGAEIKSGRFRVFFKF